MSETKVGGQAIIEGVMMRSPKSFAIAVRRPTGEIVVTERLWESLSDRLPFLKWPFVRGAFMLIESLFNGIQALMFSADQALAAEVEKERTEKGEAASAEGQPLIHLAEGQASVHVEDTSPTMSRLVVALTVAGSLLFAFLVFKGIPHLLTTLAGLSTDEPAFHLLDGCIKVVLFLGYLIAISFFPDIRRVFEYHGAEHKSIYTYEAGLPLTVENARPFTTLHPRCGTSFIFLVLFSSILIFMVVFPFIPPLHPNTWINALLQIAIKLPLMLPVAGLSYEFLRFSGKHPHWPVIRWLILPGLWMQKITTREPDDAQLEVALASLRKALWRESVGEEALKGSHRELEIYRSFAELPF